MLNAIRRFIRYLLGKRSEVQHLRLRDIVMAKAVLDIHRKRLRKEAVQVPIYAIHPIHRLDRENSMQAVQKRAAALREARERILEAGVLTQEILNEVIPSISAIKVVEESSGSYLAYEGNGRLAALKDVFTEADGIQVAVELYVFRNPKKIVRRLNRVRRMNDLI